MYTIITLLPPPELYTKKQHQIMLFKKAMASKLFFCASFYQIGSESFILYSGNIPHILVRIASHIDLDLVLPTPCIVYHPGIELGFLGPSHSENISKKLVQIHIGIALSRESTW